VMKSRKGRPNWEKKGREKINCGFDRHIKNYEMHNKFEFSHRKKISMSRHGDFYHDI